MSDASEFRFEAVVAQDGTFKPAHASIVRGRLTKWAGSKVMVTVEREKRYRSDPQNRLLWGLVYEDLLNGLKELAVESGERCPFTSKDQLHEAMKYLFLGPTILKVPGAGEVEIPPTTKTLSTAQFSEFILQVGKWAAERGIYVRNGYEEWSA